MKFYTFLDKDGFELYGVNLPSPPDDKHTEVIRKQWFLKPQCINDVWLEGATVQELEDYSKSLLQEEKNN